MTTLNELCDSMSSGEGSDLLRQACARPRTSADMLPLPRPSAEAPFDSSWETLLEPVGGEERVS